MARGVCGNENPSNPRLRPGQRTESLFTSGLHGVAPASVGQIQESLFHPGVDGALREFPLLPLAHAFPGENLHALVDAAHGPDVKLTGHHGLHHVFPQHEMPGVGRGDEDALFPREPTAGAYVEEPLDLLVDASDRLDFPPLVHRPCDSHGLLERDTGEGAEEGIELRR